jgi:maleamate amidohydrolase
MKLPLSIDPARTATIFVDLQEEHRGDQRYLVEDFARLIANVQSIQRAARAAGVPLYHFAYIVDMASARRFHPTLEDGTSAFSHSGDPLTEICAEVGPMRGETYIVKREASAFGSASVEAELKARGIEWLVVCGVWTEACIDQTVRDAVSRGFRVLLVKDACGSGTSAMHQTAVLNLANRLYGGAVIDTATACRLIAGETAEAWQVQGAVPIRFTFETAVDIYDQL